MSFRVDQKVICVNDGRPWESWKAWLDHKWSQFWHPYTSPKIGSIYTVTNVYTSFDGELCLELAEITDANPEFWEPGFFASMFRPVQERKTDISVFTKMLTPKKRRVAA